MLAYVVVLDIVLLSISIFLLARFGHLGFAHPATTYLLFHGFVVTYRLISVYLGAPTLFSGRQYWSAVTRAEIARAGLYFDIALVMMTLAWTQAAADIQRKRHFLDTNEKLNMQTLSLPRVWTVLVIAFPVGLLGLYFAARIPGVSTNVESGNIDLGNWQDSSWIGMTRLWIGIILLALIYWYGFKKVLVIGMSLFLMILAYQGYGRGTLVFSVLFMVLVYLSRHKQRWPSRQFIFVFLPLIVMFFPLKAVGIAWQEEQEFDDILNIIGESADRAATGEHGDTKFLDMFASYVTLTDRNGKFYLGETYLSIITLPIPRPLWPDKPNLFYLYDEFNQPDRPQSKMGHTPSFLGEFYYNFGLFGIFLFPYILAYSLARFYFYVIEKSHYSTINFIYLILAANSVHLFRDGPHFMITFAFIRVLPLSIIWVWHLVFPPRKTRALTYTSPLGDKVTNDHPQPISDNLN